LNKANYTGAAITVHVVLYFRYFIAHLESGH